jgi:hypothetical protein
VLEVSIGHTHIASILMMVINWVAFIRRTCGRWGGRRRRRLCQHQ